MPNLLKVSKSSKFNQSLSRHRKLPSSYFTNTLTPSSTAGEILNKLFAQNGEVFTEFTKC